MTHEARPSNGAPFIIAALPFALISLLILCSGLDSLKGLISEDISVPRITGFLFHVPLFLVFAGGGVGGSGFFLVRSQKKLAAWKEGGGEARLEAQQTAFRAAHAQAQAQQLAELSARGIHLLAPYTPKQALGELDRYVDSVVGPTLRQGEIILDRAYGTRGDKHLLVCVTSQRIVYLETTFLGMNPAQKCLSIETVELTDVAVVHGSSGGLGLEKRDGTTTGCKIPTLMLNTGFSDQGGFAQRVPVWVDATVRALQAGATFAPPSSPTTAAQGAPPGSASTPSVQVCFPDGSVHPALVLRAEGDQAFCRFGNGSEQWVPRSAIRQ